MNASASRERRFVYCIEFDPADANDNVYIPSHGDIDLTGVPGTVLNGRVLDVPAQSQTLYADDGRSTVGNLNFSLLDVLNSLTEELRDRLNQKEQGLRGKRVRYYSGFRGLDWVDYELEGTQFANSDLNYHRSAYRFSTYDRLGDIQVDIFTPIVLNLAQPIDDVVTTIPVFTTTGVLMNEHGASYSDGSNSGSAYAYFRIEDEIIRVLEGNVAGSSLNNVTRGALGTRAVEHTTDETKGQERGKEVSEIIYLEMPWPKLIYAVLTGALIGQTGTLPPHWSTNLLGTDVDLNTFTNIGSEFYDQTDDTLGVIERWVIDKQTDAKRFCEAVAAKYGCFLFIDVEGQVQLKRIAATREGSAVVDQFDESNIIGIPALKIRHSAISNNLLVKWNEINGTTTRSLEVVDSRSIARHGLSPQKTINALGWAGSRLTEQQIKRLISSRLELYAGPPLEMAVTVQGSRVLPEIGDAVRIKHSGVEDYTAEDGGTLDRAMLVVGKKTDLRKGKHVYRLLGSSAAANAEIPEISAPVIPDLWYSSSGTNIANLAGVVDTGTELLIPDGHSFNGGADMNAFESIFFAQKNVRWPAGFNVRINGNVQFRLMGTGNTIDGDLGDGAGVGLGGISDSFNVNNLGAALNDSDDYDTLYPTQAVLESGIPGYYGTTQADGGLSERVRRQSGSTSKYAAVIQSLAPPLTQGLVEAIPNYNPTWDGTKIVGLPIDLRGTSGGPGGVRHWDESRDNLAQTNRGGTGGQGGPGILIVTRGLASGLAGRIITSGQDGGPPTRNAGDQVPAWSGGGAGGAPGAFIAVIDGATGNTPILTNGNVVADYGITPEPSGNFNRMDDAIYRTRETRFGPDTVDGAQLREDRLSAYKNITGGRKAGLAAARYFFLTDGTAVADPDANDQAILAAQQITATVAEAYSETDDSKTTVFVVTVTRVSVTDAYAGAAIYIRAVGKKIWERVGSAEDIGQFKVPADGTSYQVQLRPTLVNGREDTTGFVNLGAASDASVVPVAPNSLQAFDRVGGDHLAGQVPLDIGNGGYPRTVLIYQGDNNSIPDPTPIAEVGLEYDDSIVPRFIFGRVLPDVSGQPVSRWYWIRAKNAAGNSARFPSGTGIPAASEL